MNVRSSLWHHVTWVLLVVAVVGCTYIDPSRAGPAASFSAEDALARVMPPVPLPPEAIDQVGVWAFQVWLKTVKVSRNAEDRALVDGVVGRITKAAKKTKYAKAAEQFKWEFRLIENDEPNAVAFPGGKIAVNTGLLYFTKRNREWLAVALGHEVVHALARHAGERMNEELKRALATAAIGGLLTGEGLSPEATAGVMVAMGVSWEGAVLLPWSRTRESEADHVGLLLMAQAGYNPGTAITFWDAMEKRYGGARVPEFLSTHPSVETRRNQLEDLMPEALKLFREVHFAEEASREATPTATQPKVTSEGRYSIEVASLVLEENARSLKQRLEKLGYAPDVRKTTSRITHHQVYVGEFSSREDAERTAGQLNVDGFPSTVVALKGDKLALRAGSFLRLNEAIDLAHNLQTKNYTTKIVSEPVPTPVHQVRVGKYENRTEALTALEALKREGFAPLIVSH